MPTIARFEIEYLQFLDENAKVIQTLPAFAQDHEHLLRLYRSMLLTRTFDKKAVALQRTGKMGTYPSSLGQEAVATGLGDAMKAEDVFCPYYRDQGALFERGVALDEIFSYWGGDERGADFQKNSEDFPPSVPIATQCLHAVGVAYAFQYRKQARVAVTSIGEGGTSEGAFYEAMNCAGAWNLPVVFVVNNNQWAISVPREIQTHTATIAQKAIAAGFTGIQVDGNDVIAVRHAVSEAIENARSGGGPKLIEAVTYRLSDHTTADDMTRYVPDEKLAEAKQKEPIHRLREYLIAQNVWSEKQDTTLQQELIALVDKAAKNYGSRKPEPATHIFDFMYAELPEQLLEQREMLGDIDG